MRITYDAEADAAYIKLRSGSVHRTRKVTDGLLVDVDRTGNMLGVEILFIFAS